jgi:hypothetical protein
MNHRGIEQFLHPDRVRRRGKPPAFQWYPKDCDSDEAVRAMDDREFGFFVRCLNHSWLNRGIPADLTELARVLGRPKKYIERLWVRVGKCFVSGENGRLVNPKQEEQRSVQEAFSESKRVAADTRWHQPEPYKSDARALHTECPASPSASAEYMKTSATPDGTALDAEFDYVAGFEELWNLYPAKGRTKRPFTESVYVEHLRENGAQQTHVAITSGINQRWLVSQKWTDGFVPDLANFIAQKRYEETPEPYLTNAVITTNRAAVLTGVPEAANDVTNGAPAPEPAESLKPAARLRKILRRHGGPAGVRLQPARKDAFVCQDVGGILHNTLKCRHRNSLRKLSPPPSKASSCKRNASTLKLLSFDRF